MTKTENLRDFVFWDCRLESHPQVNAAVRVRDGDFLRLIAHTGEVDLPDTVPLTANRTRAGLTPYLMELAGEPETPFQNRFLASREQAKAFLGVPIRRGNEVAGVLSIYTTRDLEFDERRVGEATALAAIISAARDLEEIMDTQTLIASLEAAPGIIIGLIREVPRQNLKRRPAPNKWSAHEHACHLSTGNAAFLARLELMLSAPHPQIKSMEPSPDEEAGSLLSVDLDEALRYVRERALVVKRLKELSAEDWQRTAEHEAFSHYSVHIMFKHMLMHEMLHAYRIDELMLKKDWK